MITIVKPIEKEKRPRHHSPALDFIRVFALISISLNHCLNRVYPMGGDMYAGFAGIGTASAVFAAVVNVFSRIGVPLFLMITGAIFLNRAFPDTDSIKKFYKENFLSLFITTVIWYVLFFFYLVLINLPAHHSLSDLPVYIKNLVRTVLLINPATVNSMWYMPMILAIYLILPFVARAIRGISVKVAIIPIAVVVFGSMVVPDVNDILRNFGIERQYSFALQAANMFSMYLVYVLFGYYLTHMRLRWMKTPVLLGLTIALFLLCVAFQFWSFHNPSQYNFSYHAVGLLGISVGTFELLFRFTNREFKCQPVIAYLSKISFAVYFVHIWVLLVVRFLLKRTPLWSVKPLCVLLLEVAAIGLSTLIIWVFSKVPVFKKYVFRIK